MLLYNNIFFLHENMYAFKQTLDLNGKMYVGQGPPLKL